MDNNDNKNIYIREDGVFINKKQYNIFNIKSLIINDDIKDIVYKYNSLTNKDGIFIGNLHKPFINKKEPIKLKNGSLYYVSDIEDLKKLIENENEILINSLSKPSELKLRDFKLLYKHLTNTSRSLNILDFMLKYIESYIMTYEHLESNIVYDDLLDISNNVYLVDDIAKIYPLFIDYLVSSYVIDDKELIELLNRIYEKIFNTIINNIDIKHMYSISLTLNNDIINIVEYATPAIRRYYINNELIQIANDHSPEDEHEFD